MYRVSAGVRSTVNNDGGIVLDIDHGQMFRLNSAGALILDSLGKGHTEIEIGRELALRYDVSEEIAIADVREFFKSLEAHRLVHSQPRENAL
jgi:hypothetical protein